MHSVEDHANGTRDQMYPQSSLFDAGPSQIPSPNSPSFPITLHSTTVSTYHGPGLPAPSPVSQPPFSPTFVSSSKRFTAPMPEPTPDTRSTNSLSTTASTSSRTLRTPHSKLEHSQSPVIISSSSSLNDQMSPTVSTALRRVKEVVEPSSPTPTQIRVPIQGRTSSEHNVRQRLPPPPLALRSLPSATAGHLAGRYSERQPGPLLASASEETSKPLPALLDPKKENRLSQDWIAVSTSDASGLDRLQAKTTSILPRESPAGLQRPTRLPLAEMVRIKQTISPQRPGFERTMSAPPVSPTGRQQRDGRKSLDHMRRTDPATKSSRLDSSRSRPAPILDASTPLIGDRLRLHDEDITRSVSPLRMQSSEDVLRPSTDFVRDAVSRKELKAMQKEQHQALGVAGTGPLGVTATETDRKTSGLSLKKSTGALKSLFNRGVSGRSKDHAETPPMPPMTTAEERAGTRTRPSTAPLSDPSQPRPSFGRPRKPDPRSPSQVSSDWPSDLPGRASLAIEGSVQSELQMDRAPSQGNHPTMELPTWSRLPLRDLPPLPLPSPILTPPTEHRPLHSTLAEALPTSSLPYLSRMRASFLLEQAGEKHVLTPMESVSSASSSSSTTEASPSFSDELSRLKPSRSLHLLQLPELDLALDFAFDEIGMSPDVPCKPSPRRTSQFKHNPSSPSTQRSLTVESSSRHSPDLIRTGSERPRSQSFDGPGSGTEQWRVENSKLFATSVSSSAPIVFSPVEGTLCLEDSPKPVRRSSPHHVHNQSFATSQPSAPSSSDHARTPSNASSNNETPSPSPPHTPREEKSPNGLGFGHFESSSNAATPTPAALEFNEHSGSVSKPFNLSRPPSVPLPPLPTQHKSASLIPSAVFAPAKIVKLEGIGSKGPRGSKRELLSRSRIVNAVSGISSKALGREFEHLLHA